MFHMLRVEYEKNPTDINLLHTSRIHCVSKLQAWFCQHRGEIHASSQKYDAKTAFFSFREGTLEKYLAKKSSQL